MNLIRATFLTLLFAASFGGAFFSLRPLGFPYLCPDGTYLDDLSPLAVAECSLRYHELQSRDPLLHGRLVPRVIHQSWKTADFSKIPTAVLESIVSFNKENSKDIEPGYFYILWTDTDLDHFVRKHHPDLLSLWNDLPHPIFKADLARYLLLQTFGGLYTDGDTRALKPMDKWFDPLATWDGIGVVVGVETDGSLKKDWKKYYPRELHICQWSIVSAPNHPFIRLVVSEAVSRLSKMLPNSTYMSSETAVQNTAGPTMFTDQVYKYLKSRGLSWRKLLGSQAINYAGTVEEGGKIAVLPITGFSPGVGHMGSKSIADFMAKIEHRFMGTWRHGAKEPDTSPPRFAALASSFLKTLAVPGIEGDLGKDRVERPSRWPRFAKLSVAAMQDEFGYVDEEDGGSGEESSETATGDTATDLQGRIMSLASSLSFDHR